MKSYSPILEVFSLDEAFLELDGDPYKIAFDIKKRIREEIGEWITVSIGISYNKLLAKLAGIEAKLNLMGVKNILALRKVSLRDLIRIFGDFQGNKLYDMAYGIDDTPLVPYCDIPYPKSVSRTFTLFRNETDPIVIKKTIYNLCLEAGEKLRSVGMAGRQVAICIRGGNNYYHTPVYGSNFTRKVFTNDGEEIFKIAYSLFKGQTLDKGLTLAVRFIGIYVGLLERTCNLAMSIFEEERKREKVLEAMDRVNNKYGDFTIYPATILGGELIRPEVNGYFGDKKIRLESNFLH